MGLFLNCFSMQTATPIFPQSTPNVSDRILHISWLHRGKYLMLLIPLPHLIFLNVLQLDSEPSHYLKSKQMPDTRVNVALHSEIAMLLMGSLFY